jgi:nucleotide-binding universal stress UspA family protein
MKKTILVATDFSSTAFNAACYAADMAVSISADILLVHIYHLPVAFSEVPPAISEEEIRLGAEMGITNLKNEMIRRTDNSITVMTEIKYGSFSEQLETICNRIQPYAVILGSQGTTATERFLFGSHAVHAMKYLEWPLITIPPKTTFSSIKKIGLACDFENVLDTVPSEEIKTLVNDFNAKLHVLNISKTMETKSEIIAESAVLQELLGSLKPEYHFMASADINEGIMDFAETNHIDLLIVIPRSHRFIDKLMHRSHTKQFVLHSPVPVVAIHE